MNKMLINYLILVCGLMAIATFGFNMQLSAALKMVLFLSVPVMIALGTVYIIIEHSLTHMRIQKGY